MENGGRGHLNTFAIEGARAKKDACWKDCSVVKEDGGRNPAESL
jgi:hypothetical protein